MLDISDMKCGYSRSLGTICTLRSLVIKATLHDIQGYIMYGIPPAVSWGLCCHVQPVVRSAAQKEWKLKWLA